MQSVRLALPSVASPMRAYTVAVVLSVAGTLIAFATHKELSHANLSLIFLVAVLVTASFGGLGASLLASLLSFLAFNFFFTAPYYTLQVSDDSDLGTLFLFFFVAAITGHLAGRMQREVEERRVAARNLRNLNEFARRLAAASGTGQIMRSLAEQLAEKGVGACVCLACEDQPAPSVEVAGSLETPGEGKIARWLDAPSEAWTEDGDYSLFPLSSGRVHAVAAVSPLVRETVDLDLMRGMCDQASVALERTRLETDLEQARIVSETEQLRSALLSSVSHDLRTPLASIIGSTTSLIEYGDAIGSSDRLDLLRTVVTEARRLDRYIQNLLDMTRLGHGNLKLSRDWVDLADIVSSAVSRIRTGGGEVDITITIAPDIPLMWVHGVLIEQALVNLLDNAVKHSPAGTGVTVTARRDGHGVVIDVIDHGPGIPSGEREKVFDMFYTVRKGDGGARGTGLGLAICRGLVAAHGGEIKAHAGPDGAGTRMTVTLPVVDENRPDLP